jgi:hypothetical protein
MQGKMQTEKVARKRKWINLNIVRNMKKEPNKKSSSIIMIDVQR